MKKIKIALLFFICMLTVKSYSQDLKFKRLDKNSELLKGISYKGKLKEAIQYFDKRGEHVVITTETGIYRQEQGEIDQKSELFAYHFDVDKDKNLKQTWRVYDFTADCPVEIAADFIKNTFQVTDLDNDGIAEIWLVYQLGCHGDISPWDMKIIMYEGKQKYAMRGRQKVIMDEFNFGGDYKFDNAFNNGSKVFRQFAQKLWNKNIMMKWNDEEN